MKAIRTYDRHVTNDGMSTVLKHCLSRIVVVVAVVFFFLFVTDDIRWDVVRQFHVNRRRKTESVVREEMKKVEEETTFLDDQYVN
jgi:hypothetical protein